MIVTDYARPTALMVPHYETDVRDLLERVAVLASQSIGVILLTQAPALTAAFVQAQPRPDHFSTVRAVFDTPWIRDRSPIAVRVGRSIRWVLPRYADGDRELDAALFGAISGREWQESPLVLEHGNLVAGPGGLAFSSTRVLAQNPAVDRRALRAHARTLGIRRWTLFRALPSDPIGHADTYVRFLRPGLAAIACSDSAEGRSVTSSIEGVLERYAPQTRVLHLPLRSGDGFHASPLNWIQIGRHLIVPTFAETADADRAFVEARLRAEGFGVDFVESPTSHLGGSVHCLTASVYVSKASESA